MLVSDVHRSVVETKSSNELNSERLMRKNNIVAYENGSNSNSKDKENTMNMLKEITNEDMEKEIVEVFRMGRRTNVAQIPRPILIKFVNPSQKLCIREQFQTQEKSSEL